VEFWNLERSSSSRARGTLPVVSSSLFFDTNPTPNIGRVSLFPQRDRNHHHCK
jgi:hypothetical protein